MTQRGRRIGCVAVVRMACAQHRRHSLMIAARDEVAWLAADALCDQLEFRSAVVRKLEYREGEEGVILEALRDCT